jgi:hypothetical protein
VHQNLQQAPLICGLVHQNLQHDWWKEGPKYEQMAVADEAQQEDEDDESVVQNSNSFLLFCRVPSRAPEQDSVVGTLPSVCCFLGGNL